MVWGVFACVVVVAVIRENMFGLSDLLEHYPLAVWGVLAYVVVVAVNRENMFGGGVVVLPLECEVYYR